MTSNQIVLLVFGLLILLGGYMGYRAGSKVSLIAGSTSGTLLLLAFALTLFYPAPGFWAAAVIGLVLCVSFWKRLTKTGKFMPSGVLLLVSIAATVLLVRAALA